MCDDIYTTGGRIADGLCFAEEALDEYTRKLCLLAEAAKADPFVGNRVQDWLKQAKATRREIKHAREAIEAAIANYKLIHTP